MSATPPSWADGSMQWVEGQGWMRWDGRSWVRADAQDVHNQAPQYPSNQYPSNQYPSQFQPTTYRPGFYPGGPYGSYPAPYQPGSSRTPAHGLYVALAGAAAVAIGALIPFVSKQEGDDGLTAFYVKPDALHVSFVFGLVLAGVALIATQDAARKGFAIVGVVLAALGVAGYSLFTAVGYAGVQVDDPLGSPVTVHWHPSGGVGLSIIGCLVMLFGSIRLIRAAPRRH
ncbi:MAG: hypothetical protein JO147_10470 [Actinobacteria bacterium]|nr:hypothetical protein [Actinomycetota bacterium]